ncbi:hypothetical protein DAPPUDRAFT_109602 [Daphnia pulex]|uniref:Protein kinase domain-containing protein n=1 Tax=Daphnia pulex TaxID=6669 RepID=E9H3K6_DAPPU|nr:hypothetical protein DAPPUDRAFT_109602 [Daphnia pulex]|eukprot:EFX73529.1 hypothetical protein DAPPUDRAFT_109602 [Daphnia pulex]
MAHQVPLKNVKIRSGVTFQVSEDLVCSCVIHSSCRVFKGTFEGESVAVKKLPFNCTDNIGPQDEQHWDKLTRLIDNHDHVVQYRLHVQDNIRITTPISSNWVVCFTLLRPKREAEPIAGSISLESLTEIEDANHRSLALNLINLLIGASPNRLEINTLLLHPLFTQCNEDAQSRSTNQVIGKEMGQVWWRDKQNLQKWKSNLDQTKFPDDEFIKLGEIFQTYNDTSKITREAFKTTPQLFSEYIWHLATISKTVSSNENQQKQPIKLPQVLGKGTFGIVMKRDYIDRKGNRYPAAFKKCNRDLSPDVEKKFDQEIETLRELKHLFVVKYIDVVVENDTEKYIVMELCQGSVKDYVEGKLEGIPKDSLDEKILVGQITLGLAYIQNSKHSKLRTRIISARNNIERFFSYAFQMSLISSIRGRSCGLSRCRLYKLIQRSPKLLVLYFWSHLLDVVNESVAVDPQTGVPMTPTKAKHNSAQSKHKIIPELEWSSLYYDNEKDVDELWNIKYSENYADSQKTTEEIIGTIAKCNVSESVWSDLLDRIGSQRGISLLSAIVESHSSNVVDFVEIFLAQNESSSGPKLMKLLLKNGGDPNTRSTTHDKSTPIQLVASNQGEYAAEILKLLLDWGGKCDALTSQFEPIHFATMNNGESAPESLDLQMLVTRMEGHHYILRHC